VAHDLRDWVQRWTFGGILATQYRRSPHGI
jgi:hypothetical protein